MENLKIKIGLFSLLVAFAASTLLTSCEQENTLPEFIEETHVENSIIFALPDDVNILEDETIIEYIESLSDNEIAALSIYLANDELESRWCWTTIYEKCVTHWNCHPLQRKYLLQRCNGNYRWVWASCCYSW